MTVRRIFVEKRQGFDIPAQQLCDDLKETFHLDGLEAVRIINRYDIEGLSDEEYEKVKFVVFAEAPVDKVYEETLPAFKDSRMFAVEYLPGQYDQRADSAAQAVQLLGMPEARITLAHATVAAATAPKSNAAYMGLNEATADLRAGKGGLVPPHLRDAHYSGAAKLGHGEGYKYPHDYPHGVVAQTYLPEDLLGARYYQPTENGQEAVISERVAALRQLLNP